MKSGKSEKSSSTFENTLKESKLTSVEEVISKDTIEKDSSSLKTNKTLKSLRSQ